MFIHALEDHMPLFLHMLAFVPSFHFHASFPTIFPSIFISLEWGIVGHSFETWSLAPHFPIPYPLVLHIIPPFTFPLPLALYIGGKFHPYHFSLHISHPSIYHSSYFSIFGLDFHVPFIHPYALSMSLSCYPYIFLHTPIILLYI